jgi:hypothetical protein
MNKSCVLNLLWVLVSKEILMKKVYLGALTVFTYLGRNKDFSQVVCCSENTSN